MATKATALHHQHGRDPNRFVLLKINGNKTADLGLEDGTLKIAGCPIGPQADKHRSYCTVEAEAIKPPTKAELKKLAVDLRAKANEAATAAKAAMEAADAGKDTEQAEALIKAAFAAGEEATLAAREADAAEAALK